MSIGNKTQAILLSESGLSLVVGENVDLGDSGSRNGVGKTCIVNALFFALYGVPLTKIKLDNLINKTNQKNMIVTVEFEKNGTTYRIERGRKPGVLKFKINGQETDDEEGEDDAHGVNRVTQTQINRVIGMSAELARHILAMNTTTEPFLAMGAGNQRAIIEELLGATLLSAKGEALKTEIYYTKEKVVAEEYRIKSINDSNKKIKDNIAQLKIKSRGWETKREKTVSELKEGIAVLSNVNIDDELAAHEANEERKTLITALSSAKNTLNNAERDVSSHKKYIRQAEQTLEKSESSKQVLVEQRTALEEERCPMCDQSLPEHNHSTALEKNTVSLNTLDKEVEDTTALLEKHKKELVDAEQTLLDAQQEVTKQQEVLDNLPKLTTVYDSVNEAYQHKASIDSLQKDLAKEKDAENPYTEQIESLSTTGIEEVSYDELNRLTKIREHQDFLVKLLLNKNSFIRKKIIEQNLHYLNARLSHYLEKLGLPHKIRFMNDLSVEILKLGEDYDFDNLSRGEKNRLILGLSFAFRDVWESLNSSCNLLFIDELIDNGLDQVGVENAVGLLKHFARERAKDIYLISHKEELFSRVSNILMVRMENGFTSFSTNKDEMDF